LPWSPVQIKHTASSILRQAVAGYAIHQRAGPSGRRDWISEIKKIWLQQTQCEIHSGHGDVWPSLMFGLQSMQSAAKIERATTSNSVTVGAGVMVFGGRPGYPHSPI